MRDCTRELVPALAREERREERTAEGNGVVTNGEIAQPAAESTAAPSGGVTSSPLPPPSPKSLSRSPSLRRKELRSVHESVTSFIEAETSPLLKEIDNALNQKYDLVSPLKAPISRQNLMTAIEDTLTYRGRVRVCNPATVQGQVT
ncbi:uncharacterized protein LOC119104699 [Pollicipes pollicipes]|uniref:uncharacterized protein LOC119104699 n=1 Tax=Pollicipes pollicipes TaxID=41117 RepID=UPI0018854AB3|nr:uncharacterized protein LOC119104699 [Pollicipes pollicipes]